MADLHNPLFEDEKEFLERQKLEYERALKGDVEEIKAKTQTIGKYAAMGAGVLGGIWLLSKAFGSKKKELGPTKKKRRQQKALADTSSARRLRGSAARLQRPSTATGVDIASADDLGFGAGRHQYDRGQTHERAHIAPDVYHTDTDPFAPVNYASHPSNAPIQAYQHEPEDQDLGSEASSVVASAFKSFLQSDTGKMLVAQASAVLMAYVAKKASEYLPVLKNPDLATPTNGYHTEPETRDVEFTYHDDDADAPHQSL
ncbi:hypothetical protein HMJ29_07810 [Hymenobacter taeanensis]|uniref:Uncharacterized protein n=1 Tax=Hymenobacter taeanensis TaxID=2735321 RepID=A0A6M6BFR9_9BACT|nr:MULTISPECIES: hypothetical protein [Hymenobacter]QJX46850.1 hypothetical protein HMJ29_07810 [Hymenobacter taeanensis]UOQ80722.1 hypothetical protein MUN83_18160 [Hymenobacter sp. 5414T-23]